MFIQRVKHYHQWLRTAIPFKTKSGQIPSDSVRIQGPSKRPSSGHLYPVSSVKERNRKGGKCKKSPVSSPQASPKVEAGHRLKQAQHFSTCRKVPNGNSRAIRTSPITGIQALSRGLRLHQYLDDWLIRSQSQEEAQVNTQAVVDLTQFLGWIINQEKSELKPTQVFSFVGYEYHLDSALVKPTQERWLKLQDLILHLKSKHVLTARCLMSLIGLLDSMEKMVPEGCLHMRPLQFHLKEHWRYPQSLDSLLPWTETISAHLDWWQNAANVMRGADLHPKDHSIQLFTDASNEGWGAPLDQSSTKGLWSDREKRLHINVLELKAVSLALRSFKDQCQNQTVLVTTQHKQTRRNSLSRDVRSPVEDHDMVPSLSHNIKSQTHSRVSECDGRPSVQVEPSAVNRMATASAGIQTDLSKVVHSSCRSVCHSSEPQTSTVRIFCPGSKCLGHRCSELKLDGSHCLCLPSDSSPFLIQKIRQ